jgi:hypothetical protein
MTRKLVLTLLILLLSTVACQTLTGVQGPKRAPSAGELMEHRLNNN